MRRFLPAMAVALLSLVFTLVSAEAQQGYRVQPGDTLRVDVLEDPDLSRSALVLPDGRIAFPLVGTISVSGRTLDQINEVIADALEPNFAVRPSVFASLAALRPEIPREPVAPPPPPTITVYVVGEVPTPGPRQVPPGTHVLQLFADMGGFTRFAATRRVQLRRFDPGSGREHVYNIDYRALERGLPFPGPVILREGDVILVPERRLFE
jgi:polysaccharide biosynthesis/export protein